MFGNRKVAFKALVGSHNYNLVDENSDMDYKYFIMPTFDDLYSGKMFSVAKVSESVDYDVHDIRHLTHLCWKANVNFLEVLFSNEISELYTKEIGRRGQCLHSRSLIEQIFEMKDAIAVMNLPYLYAACKGMHYEKMKRLLTPTSGTKHLFDAYGYDCKQAHHAYRIRDFIIRFEYSNFFHFAGAMKYGDNSETRSLLMEIKQGIFTLDEFYQLVAEQDEEFNSLESVYKSKKPNLETKYTLEDLIKELVRINV